MSQYPELLADTALKVCMLLCDLGVTPDAAHAIGRDLAEYLRVEWGGQAVYVHRPAPVDEVGPVPRIIRAIGEFLEPRLADEVGPIEARRIAQEVAGSIRHDWHGSVYVPKGRAYVSEQMKREIWLRFDGTNREQLSREYGISNMRIYQICAEMRNRAIAERNLRLF